MTKLGIVVAMEVEAMALIEKLGMKKIDENNQVYATDKSVGKYSSINLIVSGIGMENSAIAAQILILKYDAQSILNFGYAGSNKVRIGTIISPNKVFNSDFDLTVMGHEKYKIPGIEDLVIEGISKYDNVTCYSANHFVMSSEEIEPVIYDMELHGIAMVCNKCNIPLSSLKVISDCLDVDTYNESEADTQFSEILAHATIEYIEE